MGCSKIYSLRSFYEWAPFLFLWFASCSLTSRRWSMTCKKDPSSILPPTTTNTTTHDLTRPWPSRTKILCGHLLRVRLPRNFMGSLYITSSGDLSRQLSSSGAFSRKWIAWLSPKASHHSQTSKIAIRHQHNITHRTTIPPHHHQSPLDYLSFLFHLVFSNLFNVAATQQLSDYHTVHFYFGWGGPY